MAQRNAPEFSEDDSAGGTAVWESSLLDGHVRHVSGGGIS
jgi:hypothetical protein